MKSSNSSIRYMLFAISVLNIPLSLSIHKIRRRNHRQEMMLLLIYYIEKDNNDSSYFLLRDVFDMLGRQNFQELAGSLKKSKLLRQDALLANYYLTDKGRALARQIDREVQTEYNKLIKTYRDTTK